MRNDAKRLWTSKSFKVLLPNYAAKIKLRWPHCLACWVWIIREDRREFKTRFNDEKEEKIEAKNC